MQAGGMWQPIWNETWLLRRQCRVKRYAYVCIIILSIKRKPTTAVAPATAGTIL
jgi:hypothetical protein